MVTTELSFLTSGDLTPNHGREFFFNDTEIPVDVQATSTKISGLKETEFVYKISSDGMLSENKNFIKNAISVHYNKLAKNPYSSLLEQFPSNAVNSATRLNYSDFIYLRDIGVYPINRLIILRRFHNAPDYDLSRHIAGTKTDIGSPISTIIGWIKPDEDFFDFSFNEVWKTQNLWLHDLIAQIIKDQLGPDIRTILPMPGWGQSVMFSFLNEMGYTDYSAKHLPIGDANLLRSAATRETDSDGLSSPISIKFETVYELKYVQGVDPTITFHNIMKNLLTMGTEDIKFLFKGGSHLDSLLAFMQNPSIDYLVEMIQNLVHTVLSTLLKKISNLEDEIKDEIDKQKKIVDAQDTALQKDADDNATKNEETDNEVNPPNAPFTNDSEESRSLAASKIKSETIAVTKGTVTVIKAAADNILSATAARYKWPLRGAVAQATGMNMTPWHITIGNPSAPILSMNQIKVDSVQVKFGSELLFNDLPKYIYATVSVSNSRVLGRQELMRFFGVKLKRIYDNVGDKKKPQEPQEPPEIEIMEIEEDEIEDMVIPSEQIRDKEEQDKKEKDLADMLLLQRAMGGAYQFDEEEDDVPPILEKPFTMPKPNLRNEPPKFPGF